MRVQETPQDPSNSRSSASNAVAQLPASSVPESLVADGVAAASIPVVIDDFKKVGADLFAAAITSLSGFCPQQAQNVQGSGDGFLFFPAVGSRLG